MSPSAFSSNPSIKGTPVFIGAIFLLILATRLLLAGQPFDFSCQPVRCRLIALASPRLAGRDLGGRVVGRMALALGDACRRWRPSSWAATDCARVAPTRPRAGRRCWTVLPR